MRLGSEEPAHAEAYAARVDDAAAQLPAGLPPEHDTHFLQLVGLLRRRIRLVIAVAVCGTLLVAAIGVLIPAKYTAKAQLLVESQAAPANGEASTAPAADEPAIDTQVTLLASRDHLQHVLESLSHDAELHLAETKGGVLSIDDLERNLRVGQERSSRVIGVSYTSTRATEAALIANRVVQLYVENQRKQKQEYASRELAQLEDRIAELKRELERFRVAVQALLQQRLTLGQVSAGDERAAEIRELEQEAAARNQLYESLLRRQKEVRYRQEIASPDVRILSLASPPDRPSSPSPLLFILPASIIFSMVGCFLAIVADRLDRGIRSQYEISDALGLPCLGLVPQLSRIGRLRTYKYLLRHPFSAYTEAIRSLVAALQLTVPDPPSKIILASSSLPGEGKTTLAVSMAIYLALLRRRVLLVDLDFRRPTILRALRARAKRGVPDVLLYDVPLTEVIQRIPRLGLDYLPMTRCPVDPVMLFADGRLTRLLQRLRETYDCVIIDGPPLLGVTEARLLAGLADQVLFLVKWGSTRREVAQNGMDLLRSAGCFDRERVSHPCAVLTQVDLNQHARYRYGDIGEYYAKDTEYYGRSITYTRFKLEKPKDAVILTGESELPKEKLPEASDGPTR